jgi:hypothetical protein
VRRVGHVLHDDKLIVLPVLGTDVREVIVNDNRFFILIITTRKSTTYTCSPVISSIVVENDVVQHTTCIEKLFQMMIFLQSYWIHQTPKTLLDGSKSVFNILVN